MSRCTRVAAAAAVVAVVSLIAGVTTAFAAVTPGWECVPTTAGQAVLSGGTGANPSCAGGATAVLAPTYVSSGVGGKPTVEFSTVNVQVVSGSGTTNGAINGEGNLIVGYAENASNHAQTGSNNLVVGLNNGWSSYGGIVGGNNDVISGPYAASVGCHDLASGPEALAAGAGNVSIQPNCNAFGDSFMSIAGGIGNQDTKLGSSILGGESNTITGGTADSIAGGSGESLASSTNFLSRSGSTSFTP